MFLLIRISTTVIPKGTRDFNTSHVSINQFPGGHAHDGDIISIHLMFLLILILSAFAGVLPNFNTSHVSINLESFLRQEDVRPHFNTSHVSINQWYWIRIGIFVLLFQYISCFY